MFLACEYVYSMYCKCIYLYLDIFIVYICLQKTQVEFFTLRPIRSRELSKENYL